MRRLSGVWFVATLILSCAEGSSSLDTKKGSAPSHTPLKKVKIGVLQRPEYCSVKSKHGDILSVHSTGKLLNTHEVFDTQMEGEEPFQFVLGRGQVIEGWDLGLIGMCAGERRRLVIPHRLAYGERGAPPFIGAKQDLQFEIELIKIDQRTESRL
eukprot:m.80671 g.80671  ORF g.80671 m.80671 type:complete len:155 (+) comp25335_c0_seq3:246-710(+)